MTCLCGRQRECWRCELYFGVAVRPGARDMWECGPPFRVGGPAVAAKPPTTFLKTGMGFGGQPGGIYTPVAANGGGIRFSAQSMAEECRNPGRRKRGSLMCLL